MYKIINFCFFVGAGRLKEVTSIPEVITGFVMSSEVVELQYFFQNGVIVMMEFCLK